MWLSSRVSYNQVPTKERVPITFKRGYVWTRELHTEFINRGRIEKLWEKPNPERNQNRLLVNESLAKYNWFGSSSTSGYPHDQPQSVRSEEEVTVAAPMPHTIVHYHVRMVVAANVASAYIARFEVPRGVLITSTSSLQASDSSLRTWGPRIADEDVEEVIRQLYPARGLRIEGCLY